MYSQVQCKHTQTRDSQCCCKAPQREGCIVRGRNNGSKQTLDSIQFLRKLSHFVQGMISTQRRFSRSAAQFSSSVTRRRQPIRRSLLHRFRRRYCSLPPLQDSTIQSQKTNVIRCSNRGSLLSVRIQRNHSALESSFIQRASSWNYMGLSTVTLSTSRKLFSSRTRS